MLTLKRAISMKALDLAVIEIATLSIILRIDSGIHGRPLFAKLSINDFEKVKIAAIHPDFQ